MTPKITDVLPCSGATKLTSRWRAGRRTFAARELSEVSSVYLWADGIHVNIRLEGHKLCLLVMIGLRADGRKRLAGTSRPCRDWRTRVARVSR